MGNLLTQGGSRILTQSGDVLVYVPNEDVTLPDEVEMPIYLPFSVYLEFNQIATGSWKSVNSDGSISVLTGHRSSQTSDFARIAETAYDELDLNSNLIMLATPGGGVNNTRGRFGTQRNGLAVKPRFGDLPPLIYIEGFFTPTSQPTNEQLVTTTTIISGGNIYNGYSGGQRHSDIFGNLTAQAKANYNELVTEINVALANVTDMDGNNLKIYSLELNGYKHIKKSNSYNQLVARNGNGASFVS